ncbi:MAG: HAD family hydrolase [Desulfurococcales archaeon]|nr:HAD family hydrolase [Desulfurococcales archaeon]
MLGWSMGDAKIILFDLDGTLVDSRDAILESFAKAAQQLGIDIDLDRLSQLLGYPLMDVVLGSLKTRLTREELANYIALRRRIINSIWRKKVKLYSDVEEVLEVLSARGYLLGIASSSIIPRIREFIEYFGIEKYFVVVSGAIEGRLRGKPWPDVILYPLKLLSISKSKAIYVGDAEVDCRASKNASIKFIRIIRGRDNKPWDCKPDKEIRSLYELLEILK